MPQPSNPGRRTGRGDGLDGLRDLGRSGRGSRQRVSHDDSAGLRLPRRRGTRLRRLSHLRRWPRRTLVAVNVFVALCLLLGAGAFAYVRYQLGNVNRVNVSGLAAAGSGPFTLLIIGSDTRELSGSGNAQFGPVSETPGQRSDTVMLARVVPATRTISLLSIPRDLWVDIPGLGYSKINSAFNTGPQLLITTLDKVLGIPINHFVEFNFDTFQAVTDAVGGVRVWFPTPAKDAYSLLSVPKAGCVTLTGSQALAFARSRHYQYEVNGQWLTQGLSDLARIQRQQFFVKKMIAKAQTKFTNPLAINRVINGITKNLTVDKGFSASLMLRLALDFRSANAAGIPTATLPTNNLYVDGQDALSLQQPQAKQMIDAFNTLGTAKAKKATAKKAAAKKATTAATTHHAATTAAHKATVKAAANGSTPVTNYVLPGPPPTEAELAAC